MDLKPGQVVDRYRVEAELASGGMATVYRVRHRKLDTLHALKVLLLPAKHLMERLIQEGKAQAQLSHPNIVAVTDVVEVDGAPGLVMELIQGPSLHAFLRAQKLTVEQADALGRDILRAVAHAHDQGMIHRDLKPANVMLAIHRGALVPKVTDFGLAKLLATKPGGTEATATGLAMGTPAYMAPEQYRDAKNVDKRADVFSLGTILYELVTSQRCFAGDDMMEVYQAVCTGDYVNPKEIAPDLPDRMVEAIKGALEVDPADRYRDVDELLEAWAGSQITKPRRVSAATGAWSGAVLEKAAAMGSADSMMMVSSDPEAGAPEPPQAAPTLSPNSDVGSSETIYASLEPQNGVSGPPASAAAPVTGQTIAPPAPTERSGGFGVFAMAAVFVVGMAISGALFLGIALGGSLGQFGPAPVEPGPSISPAAAPTAVPEPAPVERPEPEPVAAPAPAPTAAPATPRPAPTPSPEPAQAKTGTVVQTGDGTIRLQSMDGAFLAPGQVPPGSYKVLATFEGEAERERAELLVVEGKTTTIDCNAKFGRCKVR